MNCPEFHEALQQRLDGDGGAAPLPELDAHLAACSSCRALHAAALRLLEGLGVDRGPEVPVHLSSRIAARVLAARAARRRQRRLLLTGAMAAALLFAVSLGYRSFRGSKTLPDQQAAQVAVAKKNTANPPSPSLNRSVEEAGQAMVALTRRATDETVGQTRLLLPLVLPDKPLGDSPTANAFLEPPAESLRDIQQGMTAVLEPVATSARRAVDLLLRQIPPMERKRDS